MPAKIVPLTGAEVRGPLGIAHLPRMWVKASLDAVDLLADEYVSGDWGFDKMLCEALGLDQSTTLAYLATLPSYLAYESFVSATATNLDAASVAAWNEKVRTYSKPPEKAAAARAYVGLDDDSIDESAMLNLLDDLQTVYDIVTARAKNGEPQEVILPAVSLTSAGPLGARHLPRLWMKAFLKANGALPADFNSGNGFDSFALEELGVDMDASIAFIATMPAYMQYETWVIDHLNNPSADRIAAYSDAVMKREKPEERAAPERAEIGLQNDTERHNVVLNDLMDWKILHDTVVAARDARRTPA